MKNRNRSTVTAMATLLGFLATLAIASQTLAAKQAPSDKINVNTASAAELTQVPGIGPAKAQAIVAQREKSPFTSTSELVNVKGIGDKLYAKIAPYVTVGNESGKAPGTAGNMVR